MKDKDIKLVLENYIAIAFIVVFMLFLVIGLFKLFIDSNKELEESPSPVERIVIDSITKENSKLIIEVESIDSIKDAKVIEVKSLDNDSTLKLFYELIGK